MGGLGVRQKNAYALLSVPFTQSIMRIGIRGKFESFPRQRGLLSGGASPGFQVGFNCFQADIPPAGFQYLLNLSACPACIVKSPDPLRQFVVRLASWLATRHRHAGRFGIVTVSLPLGGAAALKNLLEPGPQFLGSLRVRLRLPARRRLQLLQLVGGEWAYRVRDLSPIQIGHECIVIPENLSERLGQRSHELRKFLFRALGHGLTSRVKIPSETRIGKAGWDAPAVRCVHLADECSIAHRRRFQGAVLRTTTGEKSGESAWNRLRM